ncbi:MAG: hypothetical protein ACREMY_09175 [bacterium]
MIRLLAVDLRMNHGTLMQLARECDENSTLPDLAHLTRRGREQLYQLLVGIRLETVATRGRLVTAL